MKTPLRAQPPMRNVTVSSQNAPPSTNSYAPSVPLSVYRELAAEMQANQAMLEFLKSQNQELVKQNQQLRQEIEKLVHSAIHLQQVANSFDPVTNNSLLRGKTLHPEVVVEPVPPPPPQVHRASTRPAVPPAKPAKPAELPEPQKQPTESTFTEQEEGRYRRPAPPERASELSSMWLVFAIFFIAVFTFGASFLIVRPLLPKR